jgi:hypothetical protein
MPRSFQKIHISDIYRDLHYYLSKDNFYDSSSIIKKYGLNANELMDDGIPPALYCIRNNHNNALKALIEAGVNLCDKKYPLLHEAAAKNNIFAIKNILEAGVHVDCKDYNSNTALHVAAHHGHIKSISLLIKHKANVNALNCLLSNPLHEAAHSKDPYCISFLLKYGASTDSKNSLGITPVSIAAKDPALFYKLCNIVKENNKTLYNQLHAEYNKLFEEKHTHTPNDNDGIKMVYLDNEYWYDS